MVFLLCDHGSFVKGQSCTTLPQWKVVGASVLCYSISLCFKTKKRYFCVINYL